MNVWSSRTGSTPGGAFLHLGQSVEEDRHFLTFDIQGSLAHVHGLHHVGLIDGPTCDALVGGLQQIHAEAAAGDLVLDPVLEDAHMNIESMLTQRLGEPGRRLHTGRSRNDQVATCIVLYARDALYRTASGLHGVADALAQQAGMHPETPWLARTHGQPAQPATLAFLLMAHAERCHAAARQCLDAFHAIGYSPLGCGAVAGSTLPLDPAYTADLLGLAPPRNALLETGGRDAVLATLQALTSAGTVVAGLAQGLFEAFHQGTLDLPGHLTTGSSLMPQKRNPDALELLRGHGLAVHGHEVAARSTVAGLGLGYVRDMQVVKPHLVAAATTMMQCLEVAEETVRGARFEAEKLAAGLDVPGITATDAAEALVAHGVPFRDAYHAVATSIAQELPLHEVAPHLETAALDAAAATAMPDPGRRDTLGGPAPHMMAAAVTAFCHRQVALHESLENARRAVAVPTELMAQGVAA